MNVLEALNGFKCGNEDFDEGFNFAIKLMIKLNDQENKEIENLKQEIAKLQLRISSLEVCKEPTRWYPHITCCDSGYYATDATTNLKNVNVTK